MTDSKEEKDMKEVAAPAEGVTLKVLTKADIMGAKDVQYKEHAIPEWGGKVRIKIMSGLERDKFEALCASRHKGNKMDLTNLRTILISKAVVDENDQPLFTQGEATALNEKNGKVIEALYEVVRDFNGIGEDAKKALAKNSEAGPNV